MTSLARVLIVIALIAGFFAGRFFGRQDGPHIVTNYVALIYLRNQDPSVKMLVAGVRYD